MYRIFVESNKKEDDSEVLVEGIWLKVWETFDDYAINRKI